MEEKKDINKRPFVKGVFWIVEINGNAYLSVGSDYVHKLTFTLWGKSSVQFEISLRGVKYVNDLVYKIESNEKTGNVSVLCFPTMQDQMAYALEHHGAI